MTNRQPSPLAGKDVWRRWATERREPVDWAAISASTNAALAAWGPLRDAGNVLIYLPMVAEVNLQPLFDTDLECRWFATRTPRRGRVLTIHELGGPLEVHPFGYLQPHQSARELPPEDLDLVLAPGLVFDLHGTRLGHGAGYYDRLLASTRPEAPLVGVVPTDLVVDRLPSDPHDVAMSHLATEEGVVATAK